MYRSSQRTGFLDLPDFEVYTNEELLRVEETITVTEWFDFVLQNSWVGGVTNRANPGFCSDGMGFVYLRGSMQSGTTSGGTTVATLPPDLRPNFELELPFAYVGGGSYKRGTYIINPDGTIDIYNVSGANPVLSMDSIQFRIGQ